MFSYIKINPGTILCKYQGEIICEDDYLGRVLQNRGDYAIQLGANRVLDCYNLCLECYRKTSLANLSCVGIFKVSGEPCIAYCDPKKWWLCLFSF